MDVKEFILAHAEVPYDPVKRREYYLKNRQLKGRQPGRGEVQPDTRTVGGRPTSGAVQPKKSPNKTTAERVKALEVRLDRLREILDRLVKEAKTRSGAKEEPKGSDKNSNSAGKGGSSKDSKLSAQEKREAAKRSKEYREKNKKPSDDQKAEEIQKKIKETLEKIKELRAQIAASKRAAQKRAQSKPGSVGARNSTTTK